MLSTEVAGTREVVLEMQQEHPAFSQPVYGSMGMCGLWQENWQMGRRESTTVGGAMIGGPHPNLTAARREEDVEWRFA